VEITWGKPRWEIPVKSFGKPWREALHQGRETKILDFAEKGESMAKPEMGEGKPSTCSVATGAASASSEDSQAAGTCTKFSISPVSTKSGSCLTCTV